MQKLPKSLSASWRWLLLAALVLTWLPASTAPASAVATADRAAAAPAAPAANSMIKLRVVSARTEDDHPGGPVTKGDLIATYQFLINVDNTGTPTQPSGPGSGCDPDDPGFPDSCDWPSVRTVPGAAPIFTQGDQTILNNTTAGISLPPGKYLISVLSETYKMGGKHFTVTGDGTALTIEVPLHPHPLPPATMRIKVYNDRASTNGQYDAPSELPPATGDTNLVGFRVLISDILGQVSTDVFGNPLCTKYDVFGNPLPPEPELAPEWCLYSDAQGDIVVPNLGPNRYDVNVAPPPGTNWIQTSTLEGSHSWDTWLQEGGTGLDNEFVVAGEPFPWTVFGFVLPTDQLNSAATGGIMGTILGASYYVPQNAGLSYYGGQWGGLNGAKVTGPIPDAWVALSDLQNGDAAVYVAPANPDGTFQIDNVPDGNYLLTYWDYQQHYILDWFQVTVADGLMTDVATPFLTGWFTWIEGYVFNDLNSNGFKDAGEPGISDYLVVFKDRDNTEIDRMTISATSGPDGYYRIDRAYPMGSWMIVEAYNDRYYTTGISYKVENQPDWTTVVGAGVDVGVLPILGHTGRLDWGVRAYDTTGMTGPKNGGIVGTVFYDTTRNELDPQYAAIEGWLPGIPDLTVNLYATVACGTTPGALCDPTSTYELALDGSYARGALLNSAITETWEQPVDCQARDADGNAVDQVALPPATGGFRCLEGPLMGMQYQSGFATLDGNYGFTDACFGGFDANSGSCVTGALTPLTPNEYLVEVVIPNDDFGRPKYQVTKEEDINVFGGDQFVPQIPPPSCAGPMHTVDVAGIGTDGPNAVENPSFVDAGGSPFEGMEKRLCDTKLVTVSNGRSIAPTFTFFTDVPIPGKWKGYIIDDLTVDTRNKALTFGEKAGIENMPVGIYDFTNQLLTTITSDYNGTYEVLLPSTYSINCPTPSGVCPGTFYLLGNDPGQPGQLNPNYNPQYRTIGASFEIWPGVMLPSDLAPTQMVTGILAPGSNIAVPAKCELAADTPQLFAVTQPYANASGGAFTIKGQGFGAAQGTGQVTLDDTIVLPVTSWSDIAIDVTVPAGTPGGPHQLKITAGNGQRTVNGLTFHVFGPGSLAPFPSGALLDNFNRVNGGLNAGAIPDNWSGNLALTRYRINSNNVQVRDGGGYVYWNPTSFGANQEASFTFAKVVPTATEQALLLKVNNLDPAGAGIGATTSLIKVQYDATTSSVLVKTRAPAPQNEVTRATIAGVTFSNGDTFGARALSDGTVEVYRNGTLLGSTNVTAGPDPWSASYVSGGGNIGVWFVAPSFAGSNDARFDDFSGGTVTSTIYQPTLYEVGPGKPYATIQAALDAAAAGPEQDLVVVYPAAPELWNPTGVYYENILVYAPVKLQGIGPGGVRADTTFELGSVIDGRGVAGDTLYAQAWRTQVLGLTWDGNQGIYEGPVVYVLASDGEFTSGFEPAIDGFTIQGGDQQGFPNLQPVDPGVKDFVAVQGGGIFANAYARYLQITNNLLQSNGGAYAAAIRLGTPHLPGAANDNQNDFVRIANNRVFANGGTNLAGAIGLFSGSEGYEVAGNDICGNFSAEYGGGISHYGLSPNGVIHHNRIYFNRSYDEGGGVMIAGELPADPTLLSPGAGPVEVRDNLIQANLGNDDGGGLRFLMAGNFPYNVYNNMFVNNVSTHEGGGLSINDAPDVRVYNNTFMNNITTATATTSNGAPAPAGLSSSRNSDLLQATLPGGSPLFSDPLLFNNIFWNNRAGTFNGGGVSGIGLAGDPNPIEYWDLGVADGTGLLSPTNSLMQETAGTIPDPSNQIGADPAVIGSYDTSVSVLPWRGNANFVDTLLVASELPPNLMGDYRIQGTSPAVDTGAASKGGVNAPTTDYDGEGRPMGTGIDIGADEVLSAVPPQPPVVTISRSGADVVLSWSPVTLDVNNQPIVVTGYEVHRSTVPYFVPDATTLVATVPTPGYTHTGAITAIPSSYYYFVKSVAGSTLSAASNGVGKFDYQLIETTGSSFNWIGLPLDAGITLASALKANVEANSSVPLTVDAVEEWNATGQGFTTFTPLPFPFGDFGAAAGRAYRLSVDITAVPTGAAIWTLIGNVPAPSAFTYNLVETTGTSFNWLLLPLDKGAITTASGLKADMDANAVPALNIDAVEEWNATGQGFTTFTPLPFPFGDFSVRVGYPYRVAVDVATGTTSTWP